MSQSDSLRNLTGNMKRINQLDIGRKVDRERSNCGYVNNRTLE